jgi:CheY-like chemotaxis protein
MHPALIVVIEDNPADVQLIKMALQHKRIDYSMCEFRSGADAVRELCRPGDEGSFVPDAILLDLNTPRTDGFEALLRLQQTPRLSHVPIAILTSSRARSDRHRASMRGARYIEKPSGLKEFLGVVGQAVEEMLARGAESSGLTSGAH